MQDSNEIKFLPKYFKIEKTFKQHRNEQREARDMAENQNQKQVQNIFAFPQPA